MMKWKMSRSWRKRKEKMKMGKMMVWMEVMVEVGIDKRRTNLLVRVR